MKTMLQFAALAFLATSIWSCGDANSSQQQAAGAVSGEALLQSEQGHRGAKKINLTKIAETERLAASALAGLNLKDLETFTVSNERSAESEDAAFVVSLFNNLMTAESTASALKVNFSMSEEPIEDGVFVFTIETEEKQNLTFEMYDEEGFSLSANNRLQLVEGTNYKAINVSNLNSGNYVFKLKNNEGNTLLRKISIQQKH